MSFTHLRHSAKTLFHLEAQRQQLEILEGIKIQASNEPTGLKRNRKRLAREKKKSSSVVVEELETRKEKQSTDKKPDDSKEKKETKGKRDE